MSLLKLVVLDDYEGVLSRAPALERISFMQVTVLREPLSLEHEDALRECDVIIALRERTRIDAAFFDRCPALRLILQTGGHAYHLDKEEATKRGVLVMLGRRVTQPMVVVPELVFGLMLNLIRKISELDVAMKAGQWPSLIGGSLSGKTLGILGLGRHGRPIARIAQAFGMKVIAWNRTGQVSGDDEVPRLALEELLSQSDVVSVHLRLSDDSRGLLNRERLRKMKKGAILINSSRGPIVDESALVEALVDGHLGGAGLDVFEVEPLPESSPIRTAPNVILTPHVGWKVEAVLHEFMEIAADHLRAWLDRDIPVHEALNPEVWKPGSRGFH